MTTDCAFVDYACRQMAGAGVVTARAMFGGYSIYCDGKLVALVGDGKLFVKTTPGGRALAPDAAEAPPYPGAKPCLVIEERLADAAWLGQLIARTASELPSPKPKKPKL